MRTLLTAGVLAVLLVLGPALRHFHSDPVLQGKTMYDWRTLYLPDYYERYEPSDDPVLALGHAKEDGERVFRVCAWAQGDGELLLAYGSAGEGVEFSLDQGEDVCAYTYLGAGGGGQHTNRLDLYLFQRGARPASIERPQIKVGVLP